MIVTDKLHDLLQQAQEQALFMFRGEAASVSTYARVARKARRVVLEQADAGMWTSFGVQMQEDLNGLVCLAVPITLDGEHELAFIDSRVRIAFVFDNTLLRRLGTVA